MHGFEGARADAHGSTGWVRLKLPTALGCFGSGDDPCVCALSSAHGYGGAPLAGGLARRPEAAAAASKAGASGPALAVLPEPTALPAARAARRSRRRRQRLTILAPYNGEPWRIDGSVERARTP